MTQLELDFAALFAPKTPGETQRQRVLTVIQSTEGWITGREVAQLTSLTPKQAADALNMLFNMGRIARTGRKSTAKWGRLVAPNPADDPLLALERAFRAGFFAR